MNSVRSKEDHVIGISKLVFVTNFLDYFGSHDLWSLCEAYGKVVDVFIPNRKSKVGKWFAFVRFIRVDDLDRLINNLCTLWVGRLYFQANVMRYERSPKSFSSSRPPNVKVLSSAKVNVIPLSNRHFPSSFVVVVNDKQGFPALNSIDPPALVLDDDCVIKEDLSRSVLESVGSSLARKIICVKTSRADNILESFKVVFKGRILLARAKELFTWTPSFLEYKEEDYNSVDDSVLGDHNNTADILHGHNGKGGGQESEDEGSDDPFGLNDLLDKPPISRVNELDPSLSHPPGFTPDPSQQVHRDSSPVQHNVNPVESLHEESSSPLSKAEVNCHANEAHSVDFSSEVSTHIHSRITVKGGSFLDVLDDMIKMLSLNVQGLGNKTKKERVNELNNKHGVNSLALQEMKMDCISHLDVKFMWGNSNFQFVASDSVKNSGGILCVWEETIFKKENVSMLDNFIAIYGTWLLTSTKILIVAIYAPQSPVLKRTLWEYISERFGSIFNQSCARDFNCFISSSGLLDVKMEGFSFTWVHPSAKKMSKLDRFLVLDGIILGFPAITAVCLDRHLLDHRPILLNEIHTDFGPTPFRTFHSWFSREGFDAMVE
uniref:RNA-directed DNA polymerase, eukaryota n=1 Tax=Tanacetum cinerariifolium TaxID=118510 RepID=A0A699HHU5_TANCI|nr:RNA-directed DNA polymerase, eukaryota [Tanacetum cinerariifolium]